LDPLYVLSVLILLSIIYLVPLCWWLPRYGAALSSAYRTQIAVTQFSCFLKMSSCSRFDNTFSPFCTILLLCWLLLAFSLYFLLALYLYSLMLSFCVFLWHCTLLLPILYVDVFPSILAYSSIPLLWPFLQRYCTGLSTFCNLL
jgi:hypothetical protein